MLGQGVAEVKVTDLIGRVFGDYKILEQIGNGSSGFVYKALHLTLNRIDAIKVIAINHDNHLALEAIQQAKLNHAHIVRVYNYWREEGIGGFLAQEYIDGIDLEEAINQKLLKPNYCRLILEHICDALSYIHSKGILHCDLKPRNILLDKHFNAYLADFGISQTLQDEDTPSKPLPLGSLLYAAPEQLHAREVSVQTDIYSLGIILYRMLTGAYPFDVHELESQGRLTDTIPNRSVKHYSNYSISFDNIVAIACADNSNLRYDSAKKFYEDVKQAFARTDAEDETRSLFSSPYRSLEAFTEEKPEYFYGRKALTQALIQKLKHSSFLAIVGASGGGKTSLARAGILGGLRRRALEGSDHWAYAIIKPATNPLDELWIGVQRALLIDDDRFESLKSSPDALRVMLEKALEATPERRLVLLIDQFEELFTQQHTSVYIRHFLDLLVSALSAPNSQLILIITLRNDFYNAALDYSHFAEYLKTNTAYLSNMTEAELREVIVQPAERVGLFVEDKLVLKLLEDMNGQPGALPLLQLTLSELFKRRKNSTMRYSDYEALGGLRWAVSQSAEEIYQFLSVEQQKLLQGAFVRLVSLGEGTEDTRRRVKQSELLDLGGQELLDVLNQFADKRLITYDSIGNAHEQVNTLEVAHEALIREWGRLRQWINEGREDVRQQRRLNAEAMDWVAHQRDSSYLLHGRYLDETLSLLRNGRIALTKTEKAFIEASRLAHEANIAKQNAQRAQQERSKRRSLQLVYLFLFTLLVASSSLVVVGFEAILQRQRAELRQAEAERQALMNASLRDAQVARQALQEGNPFGALSYALQANRITDPPALSQRILAEMAWHAGTVRTFEGHSGRVWGSAFSPDGRLIVSGSQDNDVRIWSVETGENQRLLEGHTRRVYGVWWSKQNHIFSAGEDSFILRWDANTGEIVGRYELPAQDTLWEIALSNDEQWLVAASQSGKLYFFALDYSERYEARLSLEALYSLAFAPDGQTLAAVGQGGKIYLYDMLSRQVAQTLDSGQNTLSGVAIAQQSSEPLLIICSPSLLSTWNWRTGERLKQFNLNKEGHIGSIRSVDISSDGTYALSGAYDSRMVLWDVQRGELVRTYRAHRDWVTKVQFNPDSRYALSASGDSTLILWDLVEHDAQDWRVQLDDNTLLRALSLNPEGTQVFVGGSDGMVRVYDAQDGQLESSFQTPLNAINALAVHPSGAFLAVAGRDGRLLRYDLPSGTLSLEYDLPRDALTRAHSAPIWQIAYSDDGQVLVSTSGNIQVSAQRLSDIAVSVWDADANERLAVHGAHRAPVRALAISPQGEIASGGDDGTLYLWNWRTNDLRLFYETTGSLRALAFSADGTQLAASGRGRSIFLFDVATGALRRELTQHQQGVRSLIFTPQGQLLSVASDFKQSRMVLIHLWNVETGEIVREFKSRSDSVWQLGVDPSGKAFYSVSLDSQIVRWRLESLDRLRKWIFEHRDVACLPDGFQEAPCRVLIVTAPKDDPRLQKLNPALDTQYEIRSGQARPNVVCQFPLPIARLDQDYVNRYQQDWPLRLGIIAPSFEPLAPELMTLASDYASRIERLEWRRAGTADEQSQALAELLQSDVDQILLIPVQDVALDSLLAPFMEADKPILIVGPPSALPVPAASIFIGLAPQTLGCIMGQELVAALDGEGQTLRLHDGTDVVRGRAIQQGILNLLYVYPDVLPSHSDLVTDEREMLEAFRIGLQNAQRIDAVTLDNPRLLRYLPDLVETLGIPMPIVISAGEQTANLNTLHLRVVGVDLAERVLQTSFNIAQAKPLKRFVEMDVRVFTADTD